MADPVTTNVSLAVPIRGTDVGTWDTPVNGNFTSIDSMFGGITTLPLSSSPITLLTSQAYSAVIRLTGTLTANIAITLPSLYKFWTFDNQILNSPSSFAVTLVSTSGTSVIGVPPLTQDVYYDGTTVKYKNLGKFAEYWDYAAAAVPTWVTASTVPPYLNCNGTAFSSATYPLLANHLGTTTLPDSRGNVRIAYNQGTNRVTVINGDVLFSIGGDQNFQAHSHTGSGTTLGVSQFHTHTGGGTTTNETADHSHNGSGNTAGESANHSHNASVSGGVFGSVSLPFNYLGGGSQGGQGAAIVVTNSNETVAHGHFYSFTTTGASNPHQHFYSFTTSPDSVDHTHTYSFTTSTTGIGGGGNLQPTYVGGITMIRAA